MKKEAGNRFATNKGGVIKAPNPTTKGEPKATVTKGSDRRNGTNKK
ncbi:MAG: hypothetical protein IKC69_05855 [Clostridia bacterium]|nr:hypothetical protein [Clostridia bacterium]